MKKNRYTEKELSDMFNVFLEESGFYDYEWKYGGGKLKKDILIWEKDIEHKEILDWFDKNFENGLNDYIRNNWDIGIDKYKCDDCPKLVDCCSCPV